MRYKSAHRFYGTAAIGYAGLNVIIMIMVTSPLLPAL